MILHKNNIFKLFIFAFILSITHSIAKGSNAKFYSINNIHGISVREANSICKDETGFIWASSKTGIIRLTDDDFKTYQLPYETADVISVKLALRDNKLIAYTNNGQLYAYNSIYDRFDLLVNMSVVLNSRYLNLNKIQIDNLGHLWISTTMGQYSYKSGTLARAVEEFMDVYDCYWFNDRELFIAHTNGINVLNIETLEHYAIDDSRIKALRLYYDEKTDKLWIGTISSGLYYIDMKTKTLHHYLKNIIPKQPILAIEANADSTLMLGIDGQGIWEISTHAEKVLNVYKESSDDPSSLRGNGVYDIFCDENGRVWVCTYSGGVSFFDQATPLVNQINHQINNTNSLINNDVNSVLVDRNGNYWFATNNGISFWNVSTNRWKSFYHNTQAQAQAFLSLCEDNNGKIWAGTYSSGFYILDANTGKEEAHYTENEEFKFSSYYVFDILKDSQGDIWVGGAQSDLICYLTKEKKFRPYLGYPLYVIEELRPGEILLGCTYGLLLLNKETGQTQNLLPGYIINDALALNDDIWLGSSGDGIIKYNLTNKTINKFGTETGLTSNFVTSITHHKGFIWVGTENGICRFDPGNNHVQTYASILPLSNVSFNQDSKFKLKNGDIVWGTNNGAVIFNPSLLEQIEIDGKIYFQDLIIAGRSVRDDANFELNSPIDSLKNITLKYNQNTLTLGLIPLGTSTSGSKYSWMLEGYDTDWNLATANRFLTYTNIPNGEFVLKIRMFDASLSQLIAEREINVHILPPFWQTWWFRSLILTLFISTVSFLMLYYVNQLKKQHSEERIRFFTNMTHDIRTSLTLISAPIEQLDKETNLTPLGRHYLNLAVEQVRRLSMISTQLLDFQKVDIGKENLNLTMVELNKLIDHRKLMYESVAQNKNIELVFTPTKDEYYSAVGETLIEKVIDNLISNAIKYSHPNSSINIKLTYNDDYWTLEVADRGIGINHKAQRQLFREFYRAENAINSKIVGSGIGLLLVKSYVNMHGGKITCTSEENIGTTFKVVVPYRNLTTSSTTKISTETNVQDNVDINDLPLAKDHDNKMRVLVVEDNDDLRNFMQYPLQEEFNVILAEDGEVAWTLIQDQLPDMIVSDVMMPNMDGFELCRLLKSTYETSHIPIILLTALAEKSEKLHGLGLGADDYLTKPFDMGLLTQKIKTIIRNREFTREKTLKRISENNDEPILQNELNDKFVKKALAVVQQNVSNPQFGKEDFASEMNVSTSLLYKKIKSLTDQSPSDFIKTIRLNKAFEYLKTNKYSVTEVSEICGFTSINYFSTVFKKHFGKPPTEVNNL